MDHPRSRGVYGRRACRSLSALGSSPLARGLHLEQGPLHHGDRIIPARAGFTNGRPTTSSGSRDHPRSRGVYVKSSSTRRSASGSSPLARGLRVGGLSLSVLTRIIPARAGFTIPGPVRLRTQWDHPRSRGVYLDANGFISVSGGSSPLARGLRPIFLGNWESAGIIPARAGFTFPVCSAAASGRDHPRSRGVYMRSQFK